MRLDAALSRFGYCSRKEAASWIRHKRILVNGISPASASQKINPAELLIDGLPVDGPQGLYVAFNKPTGCTCSRQRDEGPLVYDWLPAQWLERNPAVTTVGRLDKETSGILLLTDDGQFVHRCTSPRKHIPKTYEFDTESPIPVEAAALFSSGTLLLKGETVPCLPAQLEITASQTGRLTICEGRYHQVRRMLDHVGAHIIRLERTSIGSLRLQDLNLKPGEWQFIDPGTID